MVDYHIRYEWEMKKQAVEVVSPFSSQMEKRAKTVTIIGAIALVGIFIIFLF